MESKELWFPNATNQSGSGKRLFGSKVFLRSSFLVKICLELSDVVPERPVAKAHPLGYSFREG